MNFQIKPIDFPGNDKHYLVITVMLIKNDFLWQEI